MPVVTETFSFPCTVDAFWRVFMDEGYLRALYLECLGFKGFEILELGERTRKLRIVPRLNIPDVLARLIGERFAYEEHGTLDPEKSEWTWRMVVPPGAVDVVSTQGKVWVEPDGDGACRRRDELRVEGKVFGLGRIIEAAAEKEARNAFTKELPFCTAWLRQGRST